MIKLYLHSQNQERLTHEQWSTHAAVLIIWYASKPGKKSRLPRGLIRTIKYCLRSSVAEPEPPGAALFGRIQSRNNYTFSAPAPESLL